MLWLVTSDDNVSLGCIMSSGSHFFTVHCIVPEIDTLTSGLNTDMKKAGDVMATVWWPCPDSSHFYNVINYCDYVSS